MKLFRSESQRFRKYLNTLSTEALDLPSACDKWNVGEVVAHLAWAVETYGGMMARGLHGDQSPIEGFPSYPPGTPNRQAIVDEYYAQAAIDLRRSLGEKLLPALNEQYDWLNEVLAGIGPEDWGKPCYHHAGIRSVETFIPSFLADLALHEWDIRSALEPSPFVSEEIVPGLLEKNPTNRGRPWSITFPDVPNSTEHLRYRFDLTGVGAQKLDVVIEDTKGRLETAVKAAAGVSVNCDTGTFVLLMYGRQTLRPAMAADRLTAEGDPELISAFDNWLQGK